TWNDDWGGPKPGDQGEPWRGIGKQNSLQNHAPQSSCAHTLCSYNSPDSHSFCATAPSYPLTCHVGPPCNGVFCTCLADHCAAEPSPTPTPTNARSMSPKPSTKLLRWSAS